MTDSGHRYAVYADCGRENSDLYLIAACLAPAPAMALERTLSRQGWMVLVVPLGQWPRVLQPSRRTMNASKPVFPITE
jgi:hypothetical protein